MYVAFRVSLYVMSFWPHKGCGKYLCYTSGKTDQYHAVIPGVSTQTEFPLTGAGPPPSPAKCLSFLFILKGRIIMNLFFLTAIFLVILLETQNF